MTNTRLALLPKTTVKLDKCMRQLFSHAGQRTVWDGSSAQGPRLLRPSARGPLLPRREREEAAGAAALGGRGGARNFRQAGWPHSEEQGRRRRGVANAGPGSRAGRRPEAGPRPRPGVRTCQARFREARQTCPRRSKGDRVTRSPRATAGHGASAEPRRSDGPGCVEPPAEVSGRPRLWMKDHRSKQKQVRR